MFLQNMDLSVGSYFYSGLFFSLFVYFITISQILHFDLQITNYKSEGVMAKMSFNFKHSQPIYLRIA